MFNITKKNTIVQTYNRAFYYGNGLFETIKIYNSKPLFIKYHHNRLVNGINILQLKNENIENYKSFEKIIKKYIIERKLINARLRITCFNIGTLGFANSTSNMEYEIIHQNLNSGKYELNENEITWEIYTQQAKAIGELMHIKSCSSLLYVQAANYAKNKMADEALIINTNNEIIEASKSNVFIIENNNLVTPPLSSACLPGIMREQIILIANKQGIPLVYKTFTENEISKNTTILFTNVIIGIHQTVEKHAITQLLIHELNALCDN